MNIIIQVDKANLKSYLAQKHILYLQNNISNFVFQLDESPKSNEYICNLHIHIQNVKLKQQMLYCN